MRCVAVRCGAVLCSLRAVTLRREEMFWGHPGSGRGQGLPLFFIGDISGTPGDEANTAGL